MIRIRGLATASVALAFAIASADAAFLLGNDASGNKKVVNIETQEEHDVLEGLPGQPMPRCPAGTFYLIRDPAAQRPVITVCTTGRSYELGREGGMPAGGYPQDTFFLFGSAVEQQLQRQEESEQRAR